MLAISLEKNFMLNERDFQAYTADSQLCRQNFNITVNMEKDVVSLKPHSLTVHVSRKLLWRA